MYSILLDDKERQEYERSPPEPSTVLTVRVRAVTLRIHV